MTVARAERTQNVGPRLGGPMMKQPTFNWKAEEKYSEPKKPQTRGKQYLIIIEHTISRTYSNHKNWLGRRSLHFLESVIQIEQER